MKCEDVGCHSERSEEAPRPWLKIIFIGNLGRSRSQKTALFAAQISPKATTLGILRPMASV